MLQVIEDAAANNNPQVPGAGYDWVSPSSPGHPQLARLPV
jgi:hypothetical protein